MSQHIFYYREASEFDFSDATVYRKTAVLDKANVEVATQRQDVVTLIGGIEETRNTAEAGDHIITGVKGERYIIKKDKFSQLYESDPANPDRFISKNVIRAIQLKENTELTAPWGEKQRATAGGWVAQRVDNPSDVYLIEQDAFKETYKPEAPAGASCAVRSKPAASTFKPK